MALAGFPSTSSCSFLLQNFLLNREISRSKLKVSSVEKKSMPCRVAVISSFCASVLKVITCLESSSDSFDSCAAGFSGSSGSSGSSVLKVAAKAITSGSSSESEKAALASSLISTSACLAMKLCPTSGVHSADEQLHSKSVSVELPYDTLDRRVIVGGGCCLLSSAKPASPPKKACRCSSPSQGRRCGSGASSASMRSFASMCSFSGKV
mmetsp:Transcript_53383/g.127702  ORF Transcript_53383/g.127702 Transcript_53383/m.127702 type:complete len:209 (-) Transcript_53383:788-1414(-)